MRAYLGKPTGTEQPGRSWAQSMDVADMVNSVTAMLSPLLTETPVEVEPVSQEDEEQSAAEGEALNHVIIERQQGFLKFTTAIKDALITRIGVLKVHVEEMLDVQDVVYQSPTDEELAYIQTELLGPNQELELVGDEKDGEQKARIITTKRNFAIKPIDPINFLYDRNYAEQNPQNCRFVAERRYITRSDLIEYEGIDAKVVEELPSQNEYENNLRIFRDKDEEYSETYAREVERIECFECYILLANVDDDDGIAQRYKVLYSNRHILSMEPYPWVPFAVGTPSIYPHNLEGESMYDKIGPIQESKTFTLRQWEDNLEGLNNAAMIAVEGQVNVDDILSGVPGRVIRARNPQAVVPMVVPDMATASMAALEYQDKMRSERGGASLDITSDNQSQIIGDTAHGVERQYSSKEIMVQHYGQVLAETLIRQTYELMHNTMREYSNEPLMLKASGQWIEVDPSEWPERTQYNVSMGQTVGQRNSSQQSLGLYIQGAMGLMQAGMGGQLVDLSTLHSAWRDYLKLGGVSNPEQYLIDPTSPEAQQAAQAQQQSQQQQMQMQLQMQQKVEDLERWKHESELAYKYYDTTLDAEIKEATQVTNLQVKAAEMAASTVDNERNREESAKDRAANDKKATG